MPRQNESDKYGRYADGFLFDRHFGACCGGNCETIEIIEFFSGNDHIITSSTLICEQKRFRENRTILAHLAAPWIGSDVYS